MRLSAPVPVRSLWSRQEARYIVVAGCTSLGYLGLVSAGLASSWHYMIAILVAQIITIMAAFPVYRTLVFESRGSVRGDFVRFLSVWSSGAFAGVVATPLLVEVFGMHPLAAQVVAIVVIAVASYLGHRFFTFGTRRESTEATESRVRESRGRLG